MTKIRIGQIGDTESWNGSDGEVLYIDSERNLLWAWLSNASDGNKIALNVDGNSTPIGDYDGKACGLLSVEITSAQKSVIGENELRQLRSASAVSPRAGSVYDYVHGTESDVTVVQRRLAWLASRQFDQISRIGTDNWERTVNWTDLSDSASEIERDPEYFAFLKKAIETRRLVLVLGGVETGLSIFLAQFRKYLTKQQSNASCLAADFSPEHFDEFLTQLENNENLLQYLQPIESHLTALFLSLAYSAYEEIVAASNQGVEQLDDYVHSASGPLPGSLMVKYLIPFMNGEAVRFGSHFEYFLSFLAGMMKASGRKGTLTVLLSFPGLFSWLKKNKDDDTANAVRRELWRDLQLFANSNFEIETGERKPNSKLSSIPPSVGIAIELQRLPFTDIGAAFCRQSILTVPPLNGAELGRLWAQQTGIELDERCAKVLLTESGGHPWFLKLLIEFAVSELRPERSGDTESVYKAVENATLRVAKLIGEARPQGAVLTGPQAALYLDRLGSILTYASRTDHGALNQLRYAVAKPVSIIPTPVFEEWFESGLFWPSPPPGSQSNLQGFAKYPSLMTRVQGNLVSLVVNRMMSEA